MSEEGTPLDEVMEKPLSDDIVQQMAMEDGSESYAILIHNVNPTQVSLLARVLKTMQVDNVWINQTPDKKEDEDE